jgi:hypothetical protein
MGSEIVKIGFHGGDIEAVKEGSDIYASIRRICEHVGISYQGQWEKLRDKEWATIKTILTVADDGKQREQLMLHMDSLPMWLATIDTGRVAEEARPLLVAYQKEAARVLKDHFFSKRQESSSINDRLLVVRSQREDRLSRQQKIDNLKRLVSTMERSGSLYTAESKILVEIKIAEIATGERFDHLLPPMAETWQSPTQIGEVLGISAHAVGLVITKLGVRGDPQFSRKVANKSPYSNKEIESYLYNAEAIRRIKEHLGVDSVDTGTHVIGGDTETGRMGGQTGNGRHFDA